MVARSAVEHNIPVLLVLRGASFRVFEHFAELQDVFGAGESRDVVEEVVARYVEDL